MVRAIAIALLLLLSPVSGAELKLNPVQKVLTLLSDLAAKITKEGEAEVSAHKEFMTWCDNTIQEVGFEIKTATSEKAQLEAKLAKCTSDDEVAASHIDEVAKDTATAEGELKAATAEREKTNADFTATEAELMDTIDTLARAISILEKEMAKNPALLQSVDKSNVQGLVQTLGAMVDAAAFSSHDRQKLVALVQSRQSPDDSDDDGFVQPTAAPYKSQSGNIVEVLEDLKDKAEQELSELRKGEMESNHAYEMKKQSLEDQMAALAKELAETKTAKAEAAECKAQSASDLKVTTDGLAKSKEMKASVEQDCATAESDHKASMEGRAAELEAITKAKEIISSYTPGAVSQTYSFVQLGSRVRQQQHTSSGSGGQEVIAIVKAVAEKQHSSALAQLASRITTVMKYAATAGEDPFAKVKGLISDMIERLEKEATAEAQHKAYCDSETKKTEAKKAELTSDIDGLTAKIDKASAAAAQLKSEVATLQEELANLVKLQAEMDKARADEKAAYAQAKVDLEQGLEGVQAATRILREYYAAEETEETALVQQPALPVYHTKASGAGGSIIEILEVIESDFSKNLAQETLTEEAAQSEYEKMTQENKITKATKEQDVKYKTKEADGLEKAVAEHSTDREGLQTELSAVLEYSEKLVEQCVAKPETYEERKERRAAEIAGLKEALTYLEAPAALIQKSRRSQVVARHLRAGA